MYIFNIAKHDGFYLDTIKAGIVVRREVELIPVKAIPILTKSFGYGLSIFIDITNQRGKVIVWMTLWSFWDFFIWIIGLILVVVKRLVATCIFVDRLFNATQILVIPMETNIREADQMILGAGIFNQYKTF